MARSSPLVQRRQLAAELLAIRHATGIFGDTVAHDLGWSRSKVSRYENANTGLKPHEVQRLLDYYGINGDRREHLLALAEGAHARPWWEAHAADLGPGPLEYVALEQAAAAIHIWQQGAIPDLLQTAAYARCAIRGTRPRTPPALIERLARVRKSRQELLTAEPPPDVRVILDENALWHPVGDAQVMAQQFQHLMEAGGVSLRVLPAQTALPVSTPSFTLFQFAGEPAGGLLAPDVVAMEHLRGVTFLDGEEDTFAYGLAFDALAQAALSEEESLAFIGRLA